MSASQRRSVTCPCHTRHGGVNPSAQELLLLKCGQSAVIVPRSPARKATLQLRPPSSLGLSPAVGGAVLSGEFPHFHKQPTVYYWIVQEQL